MPWLQLRSDYDPTTYDVSRACFRSTRFDASKKWTCQFFVVVVSQSNRNCDIGCPMYISDTPTHFTIPGAPTEVEKVDAQKNLKIKTHLIRICHKHYMIIRVEVEQSLTPHPTQYRSFRRRSSQPITWLILTNEFHKVKMWKANLFFTEYYRMLEFQFRCANFQHALAYSGAFSRDPGINLLDNLLCNVCQSQ